MLTSLDPSLVKSDSLIGCVLGHIDKMPPVYYEIKLSSIGYHLVSQYCKDNKVSRQYIYKNPHKFDWIDFSKCKKFIKLKTI